MFKDYSYAILLVFSNIAAIVGLLILVPVLSKANINELFILMAFLTILLVIIFSILSWVVFISAHKLDAASVVAHLLLIAGLTVIIFVFLSSLIATSAGAACYMPIDFTRTKIDCTISYFSGLSFFYLIVSPFASAITIALLIASFAGLTRIKSSSRQKAAKKNKR